MTIYANINSIDEIVGIGFSKIEKDEYGSSNVQNIEVTQDIYDNAQKYGINYYIYDNGKIVLNPDYENEEKQKRREVFLKEFFNTSLGYIRRKVNMKDGSHKDFLSDLLPTISMAVNMGQEVKVIAYDMPDFDDLKPIEEYQHNETVTPQFIQECFMQLSADFGVVNKEEEKENNI